MFIMVDGIDGSGKSTIIDAWKKYLTDDANDIFDLKKYWQEKNVYPTIEELRAYEFIMSCEPSFTGIGKVIREELIKKGTDYSEEAIAQAYSLDRLVLYKKIIIPALEQNKCVIQDRGVSTSLCYQAISNKLNLEYLGKLPGNTLALEHAPNHLVLAKISPETTLERLKTRYEKQDNVIFEKADFLTQAARLFESEEYQKLFDAHGTQVHYLSADVKIDIMKQEATKLLKTILNLK